MKVGIYHGMLTFFPFYFFNNLNWTKSNKSLLCFCISNTWNVGEVKCDDLLEIDKPSTLGWFQVSHMQHFSFPCLSTILKLFSFVNFQMVEPPDYSQGIDFKLLASENEEFANALAKWGGRMEWQDPESLMSGLPLCLYHVMPNKEACRALTRALLKRDFDRVVELPTNRLCPPVWCCSFFTNLVIGSNSKRSGCRFHKGSFV